MQGMETVAMPDIWLEPVGRDIRQRLMLSMPYDSGAFWVELVNGSGERLGWLEFSPLTVAKGELLFEASELRLATDPVPAKSGVWSAVSALQPGVVSIVE